MNQVSPKDISWKDLDSLVAKRSRLRSGDEIIAISSQTKKPYLARISDIIGRSNPEKKAEQQVGRLQNNLDRMFEDAVTKGGTIIKGGYIETDLINVDELFARNASITNTLTMGEDGKITNVDGDYVIDEEGINFPIAASASFKKGISWGSGEDMYISAQSNGGEQIYYQAPSLHRFMLGEFEENAFAISADPRSTLHTGLQLNKNIVFNTSIVSLDGSGLLNLTPDTNSIVNVGSNSPGSSDTLNGFRWEGTTDPPPDGIVFFLRAGADQITINDGSENIKTGGNVILGNNDGDIAMMMFVEDPLPDGTWTLVNEKP